MTMQLQSYWEPSWSRQLPEVATTMWLLYTVHLKASNPAAFSICAS